MSRAVPQRRRVLGQRGDGVEHHRKHVEVGLHEVGGVVGEVVVLGDQNGERLADVADAVAREHVLQVGVELDPEVQAKRDDLEVAELAGR